ncbi:hypothetical protein DMI62_14880 [Escherichia coli]|nr:hypothetical protein [Escherichia coli]
MDIGYGLSRPAFCGQSYLVVTGEFFHLLDVFSVFLLARFIRKCYRGQVFTAKYLKGIIKWYSSHTLLPS